jgi:hypothetical protein
MFAEVRVRGDKIVGAKLAHPDYLPLIASATAQNQVGVARPEGLEPPTLCLEGRRSFQLSYGRMVCN